MSCSRESRRRSSGCECESSGCRCGCDSDCECGGGEMFVRRYRSRREELEWIEAYRDELKAELEGVEERIKELKKK